MTAIVSFADLPVQAWANGAGETVELARDPDAGPFDWRLSIATVADDSEFSHLPDVDRVLVPLSPGGLTLLFDGEARRVDRYEPVSFPGEQSVRPLPPEEPTTDLNLMVRRGSGRPRIDVLTIDRTSAFADGLLAVVVLEGSLVLNGTPLRYGDTVLAPSGDARITGHGVVAVASR